MTNPPPYTEDQVRKAEGAAEQAEAIAATADDAVAEASAMPTEGLDSTQHFERIRLIRSAQDEAAAARRRAIEAREQADAVAMAYAAWREEQRGQ